MTSPTDAARALLTAAQALTDHPDTPQRLADWSPGIRAASLEVRVSGGGDHADPAGRAAVDGVESLHAQWVEALTELAKIGNLTFGAPARFVPSTVTMLTTLARCCRSIPPNKLGATVRHASTINFLVGRAHPATDAQAALMKAESAALEVETARCWACDTPGAGICTPCRKLLDKHTHAGDTALVDPTAFRAYVHDGIKNHTIRREASPLEPIAPVRIHAPTRWVCTNCQHPQDVVGLASRVYCPECGAECQMAA